MGGGGSGLPGISERNTGWRRTILHNIPINRLVPYDWFVLGTLYGFIKGTVLGREQNEDVDMHWCIYVVYYGRSDMGNVDWGSSYHESINGRLRDCRSWDNWFVAIRYHRPCFVVF